MSAFENFQMFMASFKPIIEFLRVYFIDQCILVSAHEYNHRILVNLLHILKNVQFLDIVVSLFLDIWPKFAEDTREEAADKTCWYKFGSILFSYLFTETFKWLKRRICNDYWCLSIFESSSCSHTAAPNDDSCIGFL